MDSMSPGPLFRWTSIAAPITSLLRRSAFLYNGCISERVFTEDSEGNEGWSWVLRPLCYLRFLLWIFFSSPLQNFYRRQRSKQRFELGLQHFVIFASFCLVFSAALLRIGWENRTRVSRVGPDSFPSQLVGCRVPVSMMQKRSAQECLARIAKRTGFNAG